MPITISSCVNSRERSVFFVNDPAKADCAAVRDAVRDVENRLITHNEIEEDQIYRWASIILTEPEQSEWLRE